MRVAFPMYDRAETAAAWDRFHDLLRAALAAQGIDIPARRERPSDLFDLWQSPDLLIAQTCSYPLRARLAGQVSVLGVGDHRLEGIAAGRYASVIVARGPMELADLSSARLAINDRLSQSGFVAPMTWLAEMGIASPQDIVESGAHRRSAEMVAKGEADWAALDVVSWQMIKAHDSFAGQLQVIAQTAPTPALPFITAKGRDPAPLRDALRLAIGQLEQADRDLLWLHDFLPREDVDYLDAPISIPDRK